MQVESTYQQLLNTAEALIQLRGLNAFSFRDLARELGIASSSVHHHFPTKADLTLSIVARYRVTFGLALKRLETEEECALKRLARFTDLYIVTFRNEGRFCLCLSLATDFDSLPELVREEIREFWCDQQDWISVQLDGLGRQIPNCSNEPLNAAQAILGTIQGAMITARVTNSIAPLENAKNWILRSLSS